MDLSTVLQWLGFLVFARVILYLTVHKELRGRGLLSGQNKLLKTGEPARAKIIQANSTGTYFGTSGDTHNLQEIALVLEVQPLDRPTYQVKTTRAVRAAGGSNPFWAGPELDVKIDPSNPHKIAILGFDGR